MVHKTTALKRPGITTLQIKRTTRDKLDALGDLHVETYDDIIQRIIQFYNEHLDSNSKEQEQQEKVGIRLPKYLLQQIAKLQKDPVLHDKLLSERSKPMLVLTK